MKALGGGPLRHGFNCPGVLDHRFLDEDRRRARSASRSRRSARVDRDRLAPDDQVDEGVEGVVLESQTTTCPRPRRGLNDVPQQVMCQRTLRHDVLNLQADGVGLAAPTQIGSTR